LIEKELIEQCRKGDLQNFRKVVEKTSPFVFSVAFRMLGDEDSASDIVQDTMVTIWEKIVKIKTAESFKIWVYRITMNKCYDLMRKRKQKPEYRFDDRTWALISNHISESMVSDLENKENAMIINLLTDKLSPIQKSVFILSEIEQMSNKEIAEITGMYRSSVKANLYYARKNIKEMIRKYL
jgi:RNA polymerase sigma-70 factor (ECF subfamily)